MFKKRAKFVASILLVVLALIGGLSVTAAERPDSGNLHIHKYFGTVIATHDGTELLFGETPEMPPVKGVRFDVYAVENADVFPDTQGWTLARIGTELTLTKGTEQLTYRLSKVPLTGLTNEKGVLSFFNLGDRYYYVEENLGASQPQIPDDNSWKTVTIYEGTAAFLAEVPMTDPGSGSSWLTDVHVYPKNHTVDPGKKVAQPSVDYGNGVTWRIYADIPNAIDTYTAYRIVDQLDLRLQFDQQSLSVILTKTGIKLSEGHDYTISCQNNRLIIETTAVGRKRMAQTGGEIEFLFQTTVKPAFIVVGENLIKNEAAIEFNNAFYPDPDNPGCHLLDGGDPSDPKYPLVNVGDLIIEKVDRKGRSLAGSEFQLMQEGQSNFIGLVVDPAGVQVKRVTPNQQLTKEEHSAGYQIWQWIVRPSGEQITFDNSTQTVYTAFFDGLQTHKVQASSKKPVNYQLYETKAPTGYLKLSEPVEFAFSEESDGRLENANAYVVKKEIINQSRDTLPKTGAILATSISGLLLILIAIYGLTRTKGNQRKAT